MTYLVYGAFILLFSGDSSQGPETTGVILELLGIVLVFCCVLYLAYVASRFVGKKFSTVAKAKHIQVVEQIGVGLDKQLLLIRVGSEHFLFVSAKKELKMVAKVAINDNEDIEEATQLEETGGEGFDFKQIFEKYLNTSTKRVERKKKHTEPQEQDKPLKENIRRLQHMQRKSHEDKEEQSTCQEKEES